MGEPKEGSQKDKQQMRKRGTAQTEEHRRQLHTHPKVLNRGTQHQKRATKKKEQNKSTKRKPQNNRKPAAAPGNKKKHRRKTTKPGGPRQTRRTNPGPRHETRGQEPKEGSQKDKQQMRKRGTTQNQ